VPYTITLRTPPLGPIGVIELGIGRTETTKDQYKNINKPAGGSFYQHCKKFHEEILAIDNRLEVHITGMEITTK